MAETKRLSDILSNGNGDNFRNNWNNTAAADDFGPLPPGEYIVRILRGELFTSKRKSTPGYKLTLEVTKGEYAGRRTWDDLWLTQAALPMTKRDLAKIGVERLEQLEQPLPPGILLRVKLALHRDDDGNETNKVKRFDYVGIEPADAFAPKDGEGGDDQGGAAAPDASFPFGAAAAPADDAGTGDAAQPPSSNGAPPTGTDSAAAKPKRSKKAADAAGPGGGADQ